MQTTLEETSVGVYRSDAANLGAVSASAVSWGAIFAGAAAAAGLSLILLILGAGLGFATTSPWSGEGISATTFGVSTIIWVIFMAFAASAIGGYIAGRLRTKWVGVHTHEVFFRDTAHGFIAWAVATLATAAFLSSVTGAILAGGVKAGASVASGLATTAGVAAGQAEANGNEVSDRLGYFVDSLFRAQPNNEEPAPTTLNPVEDPNAAEPAAAAATDTSARRAAATDNAVENSAEVVRIFAQALRNDSALPQEDVTYVAQLISQRTELTQAEAEQRVNEVYNRVQTTLREAETTAKEAADKARAASAYASLWFFVSLLIGAFSASVAATIGGRQRDL